MTSVLPCHITHVQLHLFSGARMSRQRDNRESCWVASLFRTSLFGMVIHLGVGVVADRQQRAAHLDALFPVLGLVPGLEKAGAQRNVSEPSAAPWNISKT